MSQEEEIRERHIVPLEQVPVAQQHCIGICLYCYCPKHPRSVKAVAAVKVEGQELFFGICGYHAEVYPLTEEENQMHSMLCPDCFPR